MYNCSKSIMKKNNNQSFSGNEQNINWSYNWIQTRIAPGPDVTIIIDHKQLHESRYCFSISSVIQGQSRTSSLQHSDHQGVIYLKIWISDCCKMLHSLLLLLFEWECKHAICCISVFFNVHEFIVISWDDFVWMLLLSYCEMNCDSKVFTGES